MVTLMQFGFGKMEGCRIALCGKSVYSQTAGKSQIIEFSHLIEGLATGVIDGCTEHFNIIIIPDKRDNSMSA